MINEKKRKELDSHWEEVGKLAKRRKTKMSDDLISRQAIVNEFEKDIEELDSLDIDYGFKKASLKRAIWKVENMPRVQTKTGRCCRQEKTIKMSDIKLKPCPFCGSVAVLHKAKTSATRIGYSISCGGENGECYCSPRTGWFDTKDKAIEAWNRRMPENPLKINFTAPNSGENDLYE